MHTDTLSDRCRNILEAMGRIPFIVQGKLSERHGAGGKVTGWKLQRWRQGRNQTRHIPAERVARVREGILGHERFGHLAKAFVAVREEESLRKEPEAENAKKKPTRR